MISRSIKWSLKRAINKTNCLIGFVNESLLFFFDLYRIFADNLDLIYLKL